MDAKSCAPLTVPYNLPRLFIATNSSLVTPYRLTTPRSTVEISIRPGGSRRRGVVIIILIIVRMDFNK